MSDAINGYATALVEVARAEGALARVRDELTRFARVVEGDPELRTALTDPGSPSEAKARVVGELLDSKAHPTTVRLVAFLVESGKGRELTRIAEVFALKATEAGESSVAEVRVAAPISEEQRARLVEVLSAAKGRPVDVTVVVDPSVLGGVVTRIGDEVIDGSVKRRLEQLRATLAAG